MRKYSSIDVILCSGIFKRICNSFLFRCAGKKFTSLIRICFHERRFQYIEKEQLALWHQVRPNERILEVIIILIPLMSYYRIINHIINHIIIPWMSCLASIHSNHIINIISMNYLLNEFIYLLNEFIYLLNEFIYSNRKQMARGCTFGSFKYCTASVQFFIIIFLPKSEG